MRSKAAPGEAERGAERTFELKRDQAGGVKTGAKTEVELKPITMAAHTKSHAWSPDAV